MNPLLRAFLTAWELRPSVVLVLVILGAACTLGWWRLRRQGQERLATGWRLTSYLSGLAVLAFALLSGVDHLQDELFAAHMVQHEFLMMVAAPLMLLADPFPFLLWGLPGRPRRSIGRLLARQMTLRRLLEPLTSPRIAWMAYVGALWVWHSQPAYDTALRTEWVHSIEHVTFLGTALLFWWHVTGSAPRIHHRLGHWSRAGFVLAALAQNEILGVTIAFAGSPLYSHYTMVPRLWGLSVLQDQMLAGAIMWIPGGMMYVAAAIILITGLLDQKDEPRGGIAGEQFRQGRNRQPRRRPALLTERPSPRRENA